MLPPSAARIACSLRRAAERHQQVRHVEASDQQHAAGGGQQRVEGRLHPPHDRIEQGAAVRREGSERQIQMLSVNAARDECEIGNHLRFGRARLETTDGSELMFIEHLHQGWSFRLVERCPELHV